MGSWSKSTHKQTIKGSHPNKQAKFAFELLQIETQCARAILRQEPDLVIIFRLSKASVDAAGKDGSLAGLGSGAHLQLSCPARQYIKKSTFSVYFHIEQK